MDELRVIPTMAITNFTISCVNITVDFIICGEVNFFVTMGWMPNCKASKAMKKSAVGDRDDGVGVLAAVMVSCVVVVVQCS